MTTYSCRMDINLIVLNVGNSRLSIGVFVAGELRYIDADDARAARRWPATHRRGVGPHRGPRQPASSPAGVNPPLIEPLEDAVKQATGQQVDWVGRDIELPIKVLTEQPEQTGVDRVLNVAAAYEQMGKACVVVDAGTAITVDCCNDQGEFLGGAIAPGRDDACWTRCTTSTAQLPRVQFAARRRPVRPEHRRGDPPRRLSRHPRDGERAGRELRDGAGLLARHRSPPAATPERCLTAGS